MGRSPCCDKSKVKRGPWSPEEDAILKNYLDKHGTAGNWIALPQKAGLQRCGKSCRLRWLNYLRPDIKHGGFTRDEEYIICNLYNTIGSRWSVIASHLPGRTDNNVKNYWNTKLKKKIMAEYSSPPPRNDVETAIAASTTATTTTPKLVDKTTIFQAPAMSPAFQDNRFQVPFITDASRVSTEPMNYNCPRFILEGSTNCPSGNNSSLFSPSHQGSNPFRPFCLGMDENNGVRMDEYSCEDLNGVWFQEEAIGADVDADLFSIFHVDSKAHGVSQRISHKE